MINSENLDICPFCKNTIPQGPAYFCPTCGKKLGEEYSKRYFSADDSSSISYSRLEDIDIIEESSLDDEKTQSDYTEFFTNVDEDLSLDNDDEDLLIADTLITDDENIESDLETKNKSIKLDVWLRNCFKEDFLENFLRYKSFKDFKDKEDQISKIISYFELEEILIYKYKRNFDSFSDSLNEILSGFSVLDLVNIAKNYDVEIALNKKDLLSNFLDKFHPYEILTIFEENDIDYQKVLKISVLEQIYILSNSKLNQFSKSICSNVEDSRCSKISCIVNNFEEGFLISSNYLDRGVAL